MFEKKWKSALTKIIEELDDAQFEKMLQFLTKIPKSLQTSKKKQEMPQTIIEHYGEERSICLIKSVMRKIPRNDSAVQDKLRVFVDKLKEKIKGEKRKRGADPESGKKRKLAADPESKKKLKPGEKRKRGADPESGKKRKLAADPESKKKLKPDDAGNVPNNKKIKISAQRNSIERLKTTRKEEDGKAIAGKVVRKSALRTYTTQKEEVKPFFHLGLADETDFIRVMVYGKEKFKYFKEGSFYSFRKIILEPLGNQVIMKVTKLTKTRKIKQFDVPKHLELKAQRLINENVQ